MTPLITLGPQNRMHQRGETEPIAYRLRQDDRDVTDAVRRIASEQLSAAVDALGKGAPSDGAVHEARKRMKKVRGLIRMVRPVFPAYADENRALRDAARRIAGLRDAHVVVATLDDLLKRHDEPLDERAFRDFRQTLAGHDKATTRKAQRAAMDDVTAELRAARQRVDHWFLTDTGFDAVAGGVAKTYDRMRADADAVAGEADDAAWHEWRKRVKYHGYHVRLLRELWKPQMQARREAIDRLGDALGLHQDLHVFEGRLDEDALSDEARRVLRGLVERRKVELEDRARRLGARLVADKPKALLKRWSVWWRIWREG